MSVMYSTSTVKSSCFRFKGGGKDMTKRKRHASSMAGDVLLEKTIQFGALL